MPLDAEESPLSTRLGALNKQYETQSAPDILEKALTGFGRTALVSSFGADAVVLLHMVAGIAPQTPILFIDTMMLFPETLAYQRYLAQRLNLTDLRIIGPDQAYLACLNPSDGLHQRDPNACCALRKTKPLAKALLGFDSWITGRKRFQSTSRADLKIFESDDQNRFKINPLAGWIAKDLQAYRLRHDLPAHPLLAKGYPSIGCAPCTSSVQPGEEARAGRWRGVVKIECGIHFINGQAKPLSHPIEEKKEKA